MTHSRGTLGLAATMAAAALLVPEAVHAYGGPGSVISGVGALLAALAAIVAAIFGFFWFPLKRLYRTLRDEEEDEGEGEAAKAS